MKNNATYQLLPCVQQKNLLFAILFQLIQFVGHAQVSFQQTEATVCIHEAGSIYVNAEGSIHIEGGVIFIENINPRKSHQNAFSKLHADCASKRNDFVKRNNVGKKNNISNTTKLKKNQLPKKELNTAVIKPVNDNSVAVFNNASTPLPNNLPLSKNWNYCIQAQLVSYDINSGNHGKRRTVKSSCFFESDNFQKINNSAIVFQNNNLSNKVALTLSEYINNNSTRPPPFQI